MGEEGGMERGGGRGRSHRCPKSPKDSKPSTSPWRKSQLLVMLMFTVSRASYYVLPHLRAVRTAAVGTLMEFFLNKRTYARPNASCHVGNGACLCLACAEQTCHQVV